MTESIPSRRIEELLAQSTWVTRLVRQLVRDAHLVDDVVQETLLRAIERPPQAREERSLRSWLATVARRLAMRRLRSEAARRRREAAVAMEPTIDPAAIEERIVLQRRLATAVLELDEPHRTAVVLCYQDGLSAKEIADRLGISHDAARQRISRGLATLRQRLEREHGAGRSGWLVVFAPLLQTPPAAALPTTSPTLVRAWTLAALTTVLTVGGWWAWSQEAQPTAAPMHPPATEHEVAEAPRAGTANERSAGAPATPAELPVAVVSIDRDRDLHGRVLDSDGRPLPGATIEARRVDETAYRVDPPPPQPPLARTASDSRGEFTLRLERDTLADLHIHAPRHGDELLPHRRAGERVEVTMAPAGELVGRLVRSADGQPMAGVPVRFVRLWLAEGVYREIGRSITGTDGDFVMTDLPPCRLAIEVAVPGAACQPHIAEIEPGRTCRPRLEVGASRLVRGTVRDADSGQPIAGATVVGTYAHLATAGTHQREPTPLAVARPWAPAATAATATSDPAGQFVVHVPNDFAPAQVRLAAPGYATAAVTVPNEREPQLAVVLHRGWSIAGRILATDGSPAVAARVVAKAVASSDGIERADWQATTSDASGRFTMGDLSPELPYHLVIEHPGSAPRIVDVERPAGEVLIALGDLRLAQPATVRGLVVGGDGVPRQGIYLSIETAAGDVLAKVRTDDLGRFAGSGLPPGPATLCVGRVRQPVRLDPDTVQEAVRIELAAAGVFGIVTDVLGTPIHNALVLLADGPGGAAPRSFVTGPDGRFGFDGIDAGRYSLRVAPNSLFLPGGDRMVHQIRRDGVEPSPAELRILLPPAQATRGTVVDADGTPLGQTVVFARSPAGELLTYEVTAADGTFLLRLPPGAVADLAVGKEAPHRIVTRGVRAGATGIRLVREHLPK